MFEPEGTNWVIIVWMTLIGGAIGSFLNVVVYRLPLGLGLVNPPSHCPKCKTPIRWFDNVPVFGWFMLRGRCRHCGNRISFRYPLVEGIAALMFFLVAMCEDFAKGIHLPWQVVGSSFDLTSEQMGGVYLYHVMLLSTLFAAALVEIDNHRPPLKLFLPALLLGVAAPLAWPMLRPVPALAGMPEWLAGAADGVIGLAAGAALGALVWRVSQREKPRGLLFALPCVGLFLGWQAVLMLAPATITIYAANWLLRRIVPRVRQAPPTVWLLVSTLSGIVLWTRLIPRL